MRLIKDDNCVLVVDLEVLSDLLVDQVVVGHEDEVCTCHSILRHVVRTVLVLDGLLVDVLDISWLPRHLMFPIVTVLEVDAGVDASLGGTARRIQGKALVQVNCLIDAKVIARGYEHRPRLKNSVRALLLHLSKL